jgi:hypothetical protein
MAMEFKGQGGATADIRFDKVDEGTKVTWGMDTDMGMNPLAKYAGLFMDQMVGGSFEDGLNSLKQICEVIRHLFHLNSNQHPILHKQLKTAQQSLLKRQQKISLLIFYCLL